MKVRRYSASRNRSRWGWMLSLLAGCLFMVSCATSPTSDKPSTTMDTPSEPSFTHGVNISHYLSQLGQRPYADPAAFTDEDVSWLASRGYDHIRLPLDGSILISETGEIDWKPLKAVDHVLQMVFMYGLNVVLDIHELPGTTFAGELDARLFTDDALQENAVRLWKGIAERYRQIGPQLRFQILNEPVAEDAAQVTAFYAKVLPVIREISPDRIIHLSSNRWARFETVDALLPLLDDPNIVLDIHYYDPHVFTHQKASWVGADVPGYPEVPFPGVVPDLTPYLPQDHYNYNQGGREYTVEMIADDFDKMAAWGREHGKTFYIGEFGVYDRANPIHRANWYHAVLDQCEKHGFGWAVWDYKGGFAVRNAATGEPTIVQDVIDKYLE